MKFFLALIVIASIALIGSRITFLNRRLPIGFRHILLTGTEYIFMGFFLGRIGLNLLDHETLLKLESFLLLGLAWIGFLFGLQFEIRLFRKLPKYYFSITAVHAFVTFLIVSIPIYFLMIILMTLPKSVAFLSAATLGATACCTAQSAIAIVNRNYVIKNKGLLELMRYISSVDGLFALLFFSVALSLFPTGNETEFQLLISLKWLGGTIVAGVIPGIVLIILSKSRFSTQEYSLFLIGTILFCGGMAHQLQYSPLITGLICGIVTANFCRHRLRALQIVVQAEKSIYILLLLVIGALWQFQFDNSLIIAGCYFIFKVLGKLGGAFSATQIFKPQYKVPAKLGLGLISEGGLVIAIVLNFRYFYPVPADVLITIVVVSVLVSEFISPRLIVAQFEADEISVKRHMS